MQRVVVVLMVVFVVAGSGYLSIDASCRLSYHPRSRHKISPNLPIKLCIYVNRHLNHNKKVHRDKWA
jgi:hypothetical protein